MQHPAEVPTHGGRLGFRTEGLVVLTVWLGQLLDQSGKTFRKTAGNLIRCGKPASDRRLNFADITPCPGRRPGIVSSRGRASVGAHREFLRAATPACTQHLS